MFPSTTIARAATDPHLPAAGAWRRRLLQACVLLCLLAGLVMPQARHAMAADGAALDLRFEHAEAVASDDAQPPEHGWQEIPLPDRWRQNRPGYTGSVWYRMRFRIDAPPASGHALFVPRVAVTGEFRLNGSVLNPDVRFMAAGGVIGSQMTNQPQWLPLPSGLFRTGENILHVRVQGEPIAGGELDTPRIGTADRLRADWRWRDIPQRVVPQIQLSLLGATLLFTLALCWRERRWAHGRFLLTTALWTAVLGLYLFPDVALTRNHHLWLLTSLIVLFHWALLDLCWHFSASRWHGFGRLLRVCCLAMLALVALVGLLDRHHDLLPPVLLPLVILRLLGIAMLLQWAWRERAWRAAMLAGAMLVWFAGFVQFTGIVLGLIRAEPFMLTPADAFPLYLVLLFFFAERFVLEREQAARARQAAVDAERMRLLHDLHDGAGSQLMTALLLARRTPIDHGTLVRNLEDALQDMRLIGDSLGSSDGELLPLLAGLRFRLQPRLQALGLRLDWEVTPPSFSCPLAPQQALNVLRVLQEAVNNAVRHAQASALTVSVSQDDGAVRITVADNGIGMGGAAPQTTGHGLRGMQRRARELGAELAIDTAASGGGTTVRLRIPAGDTPDRIP